MVKKDEVVVLKLVNKYSSCIDEFIVFILTSGYRYFNHGALLNLIKNIRAHDERDRDIIKIAIKALENNESCLELILGRVFAEDDYKSKNEISNYLDDNRRSHYGD